MHLEKDDKVEQLGNASTLAIALMRKIIRFHMLIQVRRTTRNDLSVEPCSGFWQP